MIFAHEYGSYQMVFIGRAKGGPKGNYGKFFIRF